ncbi:efflux RND transporter permease subunit [Ancylomarina sp. DW003]|uniref:Efflux RND transporter permease subunit n=1 Tax=Paralabilibaculum antarcticum TaxID=2912572 RepID=A0ABT5VS86_9BACT|nr:MULTISPECIES: efflux RND transporter permease subunit [Marinifilaceae]MDE5417164.1 efflux RND transporter permease subunit [Labilibaculum sp. DW002]MDE5424211.1 efflux RND transporter permease subunit [Ancylomarina sp. DW003]
MNLTKFAIEKSRITFTLLAVVVIMGLTLYKSLPRDSMPPYTVRVATIISSFPGAGPERVELLVTDKIEKKAQEIPEVKEINSTSRTGLSIVSVKLKDEVSPDQLQSIWDKLRRKLNDIKGLPKGVSPKLNDDDVGVVYGIVVGLISDGYSYTEMKDYADDLRDDLIKLDDAAKVEFGGAQEERIFIEFDEAQLKEYGLTSTSLQNTIASTNILDSGGEVNLEDEKIILEPTGNYNSLEDIENTLIPIGDGKQVVQLRDITTIRKGYIEPATSIVHVNGQPAISMSISLIDGANIIKLGEEVDKVVSKWNKNLPIGLEIQRLSSLDTYVDQSIDNFIGNLIQSIVIVLLVMLIFLGLRTGLIVASLIPIVTIMTLMLMGLIGMGLNQVTLAALIMALGMMVDNAIVVSESIMVKMEKGISAKEAAISSCSELIIPLLISTLTTSVAFLAFFMAESTMGDITGPIFVVITLALLSSWIISLTTITMLCYFFLKVKPKAETKPALMDRMFDATKVYYKSLIMLALNFKRSVILGIFALFFLSLYGFGLVPFIFFPDSDRNMITVDINLPLGTKIERTEEIIENIEKYIADDLLINDSRLKGITDWSSFIGQGPNSYDLGYSQDEANSSYAHILVNTSSFEVNDKMITLLDKYCFSHFPNADIKVGALGAGGTGTPIEIKVSGKDPDILSKLSDQIKSKLSEIQGTKNVKDDWGPKTKKFIIDINQNNAQIAGITNQDIATSLKTVLDGFQTGEYREDDKNIPILLRGFDSQEQSYESIETMNVFSQQSGRSVPLSQVANIVPQWQYAKIKRLDLIRSVNVSSELDVTGNASEVMAVITPWLDEQTQNWPNGYEYQLGGDSKNTADNMGAVISYLPLSAFIILLLLIIQFNSFRKTLMVISTIPLGVIGVVIGLMVFRSFFSFFGFLGVISLAGIVINNAIVLIDRIEIEITKFKRTPQDAVIAACLQRFRPIILTTFTTSFGLLPLYLGGGLMWEPMAIAIMIGLLFGTIITLVFIPAFYSILYKVSYKGYQFNKALLKI